MVVKVEKRGCKDGGVFYPDGSEFCMDIYCFKCSDGEFEVYPDIGASTDLSEIW